MRKFLGEFEEAVLLTVLLLDTMAFSLAIKEEMEKRLKKRVSIGALHTSLIRMSEKGLISSHLGETTNVRGGKRKRYYRVTNKGVKILKEAQEMRIGFWNSISELALGKIKK